jgi:hypothetical protein
MEFAAICVALHVPLRESDKRGHSEFFSLVKRITKNFYTLPQKKKRIFIPCHLAVAAMPPASKANWLCSLKLLSGNVF